MRVLALSSGTSVDAIDVALADLAPGDGPGALDLTPLGHLESPWDPTLRRRILAALPPAEMTVGEWCDLDTLVGQALAEAARCGLRRLGPAELVVSHGQTLFHRVEGGRALGTLQIGQSAWIHAATGLPVVHDLRAADIASGGHGAPLASLLDHLWLGDRPTAALNIGGIANITIVGVPTIVTGDTGPGNCLLDAAAHRLGLTHDADGALAAAGTVDEAALAVLLGDPFYRDPFPRSTGREYFHAQYVEHRLHEAGLPLPVDRDLFATLTELTVRTVADALSGADVAVERLVVSGGGARNPELMRRLSRAMPSVATSGELGLSGDAKEAYLFALLGYLSVHGLPGTAPLRPADADGPRATGADRPAVLGSLTPPVPVSRERLDPLDPRRTPVSRLVVREL